MKKMMWLLLPVMAVCRNEILTLLCLSVFAIIGIAALFRAAVDHNI